MKLSISNIGWDGAKDRDVYALMERYGFCGLEIAPTRVFPERPYDCLAEAALWRKALLSEHGLAVSSMQSIWYGRQEQLFGTEEERESLMSYTRKAIDFAAATGCGNLVFGCPKNRSLPEGGNPSLAIPFFKALGAYASARGTTLSLEANPPIYQTNFINTTEEALWLIRQVDCEGFGLNLDIGTMLENGEDADVLKGQERLIRHVHVSEPYLKPVTMRPLHRDVADRLKKAGYSRYVSIEVGRQEEISDLERMMADTAAVFG